jgi:hypothetical protein
VNYEFNGKSDLHAALDVPLSRRFSNFPECPIKEMSGRHVARGCVAKHNIAHLIVALEHADCPLEEGITEGGVGIYETTLRCAINLHGPSLCAP